MARVIPTAMRDAILSGVTYPVMLARIDWPTGEVRVHSGTGTLAWDGDDWIGVAGFGFVTLPGVGMGIGQESGSLTFGGMVPVVDEMVSADSAGRLVEVYFGVLAGRSPAALLSDPVRMFAGTIDDAGDQIDVAAGVHQGMLAIISGPSQMSQGSPVHTYEDQLAIDATDTAGRWVRSALAEAIAQVPKW